MYLVWMYLVKKTSIFLTTCFFNIKADVTKSSDLGCVIQNRFKSAAASKIPVYEAKIPIKTLVERGNSKAGACIILQDTKCQST